MRARQRGRFPLSATIEKVLAELPAFTPPARSEEPLENARNLLAGARKSFFFLCDRVLKAGAMDEQEVRASLADIIMDIYFGESAVLRALATRARGTQSSIQDDLALLYVNNSVARMESAARLILQACVPGPGFESDLTLIRRLLTWSGVNPIVLRQKVSARICERGGYPV